MLSPWNPGTGPGSESSHCCSLCLEYSSFSYPNVSFPHLLQVFAQWGCLWPARLTRRGDCECHRRRCEGEEADESFCLCESEGANEMLSHHRSELCIHWRADRCQQAWPGAAFGKKWIALPPGTPGPDISIHHRFKPSLRKYPGR